MSKSKKWEQISADIQEKIIKGEIPPGADFPTNLDLMKTYDVHAGTIQQAVNDLIAKGMVITHGGNNRRTVYNPPARSARSCGFLSDAGEKGRQELLELRIINDIQDLPEDIREILTLPAILYKTRQWRGSLPVAISQSYIPAVFGGQFIDELSGASNELYKLMVKYGFTPARCRESLVTSFPVPEEQDLLLLPRAAYWPVIRIKRLVFDDHGNLLEYCLLSDRPDCYEFVYEFPLKN